MRTGCLQKAAMLGAIAVSGCVTGGEVRPTRAEATAGPPPRPGKPTAARMLADIPGSRSAEHTTTPQAPRPGHVWVAGYWHWSGMRYEWVPGRWEQEAPAYLRR